MSTSDSEQTFDVHGQTFIKGQAVSVFIDGARRRMGGKLITINGPDAFVETTFGPVVGDASTLEDES